MVYSQEKISDKIPEISIPNLTVENLFERDTVSWRILQYGRNVMVLTLSQGQADQHKQNFAAVGSDPKMMLRIKM